MGVIIKLLFFINDLLTYLISILMHFSYMKEHQTSVITYKYIVVFLLTAGPCGPVGPGRPCGNQERMCYSSRNQLNVF